MRLLYPQTVKESSLNMSGFDEEQAAFDDINGANLHFNDAMNTCHPHRAILRRYVQGQASRHIYTIGRIHSEIFDQTKLLPPNSVLDIEFERNDADFLVLTKIENPNFTIQMESCQILSRIVEMDDQITREIELVSMSRTSMLYPVRRVRMLYYSNGTNTADLSNFNLLIGEGNLLPR